MRKSPDMIKTRLKPFILAVVIFPLSACFGTKTPQSVTLDFWEAVATNNASDAVENSTLTDSRYYDGFSVDWAGYQPSLGKVVIEDKVASINTEMIRPANSGQANRNFTTYLVLKDKEWKVDYERTKHSIHGGPLGELFSKLNRVGDDLSRQIDSSAEAFRLEMERLGKELERLSENFGQQASKSIEQYAEQLRHRLKELEDSINRALEKEDDHLSEEDRRVLREIAADLDEDSENLSQPSIEAVTKSGQHVGEKQQQLESIDNDSLDVYKKEWRELGRKLEHDLRRIMDELSSQNRRSNNPGKTF